MKNMGIFFKNHDWLVTMRGLYCPNVLVVMIHYSHYGKPMETLQNYYKIYCNSPLLLDFEFPTRFMTPRGL